MVLCTAVSAGGTSEQGALAAEGVTTTTRGVLLLHTEGVIEGAVSRVGDWYHVRQANGAQLDIRASRVAGFYRTLNEAYQSRKPRGLQATPRRHLALAHWCLEQELIAETEEQLAAARELPGLEDEKVRLEKELHKRMVAPSRVAEANKANPYAVATTRPVEQPPAKEFSLAVRQDFVRSIQPMLVRNCCQCHEADSGRSFRIHRAALHGSGDARLIRKNLVAVAATIDRDSILDSRLLKFAAYPHGGPSEEFAKKSQPLRTRQVNLLRDWCYAVFAVPKPSETSSSDAVVGQEDEDIDEDARRPIRDEFDPEIFNRRNQHTESVDFDSLLDE